MLSARAGRLPAAWYLAARRLTSSRVAAVVLLAAAAAPVAIAVYATGLTAGSEQTLAAKARLFTGAGVSVETNEGMTRDAGIDRIGTIVGRYSYGRLDRTTRWRCSRSTRTRCCGTAYWRPEFARTSLRRPAGRAERPCPGGRVPAIVVDPDARGRPDRGRHARPQHRARGRGRDAPRCSRAAGCRTR